MRLAYGLAIAVCLSFPAAGKDSRPAEQTAAPTTAAAGEKAREGAAKEKEKTEATAASSGTASGTTKRRKHTVPAPTPTPTPDGAPRKIVVRQGGAREPAAQIAPGMTPAEATRQRQNAEQMLSSTDDQLKQLAGRTLDAREQETAGQVRNYMVGARSALKEGDLRRASTLAEKAHLLAEDIVKR